MDLLFKVYHQVIHRVDDYTPVSKSVDYLVARFAFSPEWKDVPKTAIFKSEDEVFEVLLENDACKVPWEVCEAGAFDVSVFGGNLITANSVRVEQLPSGYERGTTPQEPTPTVYEQIIAMLDEVIHAGVSISKEKGNIIELKGDGLYAKAEGGSGGKSIARITQTESAESGARIDVTIEYSDGSTDTLHLYNGAQGQRGLPGEAGPAGERGPAGEAGPAGPKGDSGDTYVITEADYNTIADVVLGKLVSAETQEV